MTSPSSHPNWQADGDFWDGFEDLVHEDITGMTSDPQQAAIPNAAGSLANLSEMADPETGADLSLLDLPDLYNLGVEVLDKRTRGSHISSDIPFPDMTRSLGDAVLFSYMNTEPSDNAVASVWGKGGHTWNQRPESESLSDPDQAHQSGDGPKGFDQETEEECEARWTRVFLETLLALHESPTAYETWLDTAACSQTETDSQAISLRCRDFFRLALREDDRPALVGGAGGVQHSQVKTHSELQLEQELGSKIYKPHQTAEHASSSEDQSSWDGADTDYNPPMMIVVDRLIRQSHITHQNDMWLFPREVWGLAKGIHSSWLDRKDMVRSVEFVQVIHKTMGNIKTLRSDKYSHELSRRDPYSTMLDMPKRDDITWPSGMSLKIRPHLDWTPECNTVFEMPKAWSVLYERLKPRYSAWLATPPSEMPEGFPSLASERQGDVPRSSTEDLGLPGSKKRRALPISDSEDESPITTKRPSV